MGKVFVCLILMLSLFANEEWIGVKFFGGPLYWHAKVGGTEFVYRLAGGKERVESQSFDWDWGYRLGIGICIPITRWKILGTYTHYGTQDTEGKGVIPPSLLVNLKGSFFVMSDHVKSSYKVDYDTLSVGLNKSSFLGEILGLGTSLGIKQGWIAQEQKVTYTIPNQNLVKVKDRCCFRGIGPEIGMYFDWKLFYGLSFWGGVKGALLYGHYEVKHTEHQVDIKGDSNLFSPNVFFSFGLKKNFPLEETEFFAAIFYEADYYWRQNRSVDIEEMVQGRIKVSRFAEDLTFYGVTGQLGIRF